MKPPKFLWARLTRTPSEKRKLLYFDHNATTFLAPEVAETMSSALREVFGNPSSTHCEGQLARQKLENSRRTIASFLHGSAPEIVFTSGGTESSNLAILGIVRNLAVERRHIVTTTIEHPCVLEACRQLEREGVHVSYVPVDRNGVVDPAAIRAHVRPDTVLISVMHANNETGVLQPVAAISEIVRELRRSGQAIFLHSDGVQALGKIDVNVQDLGVDLYSISAHKIFAPKGVGALFVRKGTPLRGIQHGGRHERERRAGTENVPGAMAFARAVELCKADESRCTAALRNFFEAEMLAAMPGEIEINGARDERLPNTSSLLFRGIPAEPLMIALDMRGIAVSTGSACSSGSVEPSHVLLAMGRTREEARSSVRFSFGRYNTSNEVLALIGAVKTSVEKLRGAARLEKQLVQ
jgi:cysteine desulfurase